MSNDAFKQIMTDDAYDPVRHNSLGSMIREFYSRKMLSIIFLVWGWAIVFIGLAIFSGIRFFDVESTREQILYATIFLVCVNFIGLLKIFAWQMIHRNGLLREIKRLELQVARFAEMRKEP